MSYQQLTLAGCLAKDPELKHSGDTALCRFSIPINAKRKGEEVTTWFRCVAFGKTASFIAEYFKKGKPIIITGRVEINTWKADDGVSKADLQVVVDRAQFAPTPWGESKDAGNSSRETARGQASRGNTTGRDVDTSDAGDEPAW